MADDWDITGAEIDTILDGAEKDTGYVFAQALAAEITDKATSPAKGLLVDVMRIYLNVDDPTKPAYIPLYVMGGSRSLLPEDLSVSDLDFLARIASETKNPHLLARLNDILWVVRKDSAAAKRAAEAYFDFGKDVEGFDHSSTQSIQYYKRSLQLAKILGKATKIVDQVCDYLMLQLVRYDGDDFRMLSLRMAELLYEQKKGDAGKVAQLLEKSALVAQTPGQNFRHREYLELAAKFAERAKNTDYAKAMRVAVAESFAADAKLRSDGGDFGVAHGFYEQSIQAFRRAGETGRIEEMTQLMNAAGRASLKQMAKFNHSIDIREEVEAAEKMMMGVSISEGIIRIASLASAIKPRDLEDEVRREAEQSPLLHLVHMVQMNQDGKKVGVNKGLAPDGQDDAEALRGKVIQRAVRQYDLIGAAGIRPALHAFTKANVIRESDIEPFVKTSRFVSPYSTTAYIRGLTAGFYWDFYGALSFMLPQVEQSLRWLLQLEGKITSSLDHKGIEEEWPLAKLLSHDAIKHTLGEGLVLALKAMLTDKLGANIRNRSLHGLLTPLEHNFIQGLVVWWLMLKLVVITSSWAQKQRKSKI